MRKGRIDNTEIKSQKEENLSRSLKIVKNHNRKLAYERKERTKSVKTNEDEIVDENGHNKFRSLVIFLIISLILVLIFCFFYFGPLVGISLNRNVGIEEDKKIDIVSSDSDIYKSYCSDFLVYNNQKVITYNTRGKKTWEYSLPSQFTPNIYIKDKYMVISNNSNGKIYLFENKNEILNTQIDGTIDEIFLDKNGNMVIEYSSSGYKKILGVYSKKGKNLYNAYLSSDAIVNVEILNNAKELLVFQTNTSSFQVGLNVSIIDSAKTDEVNKIITLDNNFIYDLTIQGQNIIMLLDDKIIKCNINTKDTETICDFDSNQVMFISLSNNYYTMISKQLNTNVNESIYSIEYNRFDNTNISKLDIGDSPKLLRNNDIVSYLIYQDYVQIINKWGIEIKNIGIEFPPKDAIIFNNGKSIALIYTDNIYIVNI